MKKLITLVICMMTLCITTIAQNFDYKYVLDIPDNHGYDYCQGIDGIIITKDTTCTYVSWLVFDYYGQTILEGNFYQITITPEMGEYVGVIYDGCGIGKTFWFNFLNSDPIPEPWAEDCRWKDKDQTIMLTAYAPNTTSQWSTGQTGPDIYVTNPGLYGVHMFNQCNEVWDSIWVLDKAELTTVSVDPYTDHIVISWDVDPYLTAFIQSIQLFRDNYPIATVPYTDGQYIDEGAYGSVTSRTYTCKSVSNEGYISPFGSQKPSIHMVYLIDAFNRLVMEANDVSNYYELVQYYVALMQESGEMLIIDSISAKNGKFVSDNDKFEIIRDGILRYTAGMDYINGAGFPVFIANLRDGNSKRGKQMYSNVGANEIVGLEEVKAANNIQVYPNPTQYQFTISGVDKGEIIMINGIGQQILCQEIIGETTVNVDGLPSGIYFARISTPLGVYTKKVVVE